MRNTIKISAKKNLYVGFNQLDEYDLQVPSLNLNNPDSRICRREILKCSDAVFILIYAPEIDSFVFCQEFRAGVFINPSADDPFILECAAGMIDRESNPEQIARAEVYEETGLTAGDLQLIAAVYSSPGRITEKVYVYFTEVMGVPTTGIFGLADEHEEIITHLIKREEVYRMMDELKIIDSMTLLALNWFRCRDTLQN